MAAFIIINILFFYIDLHKSDHLRKTRRKGGRDVGWFWRFLHFFFSCFFIFKIFFVYLFKKS